MKLKKLQQTDSNRLNPQQNQQLQQLKVNNSPIASQNQSISNNNNLQGQQLEKLKNPPHFNFHDLFSSKKIYKPLTDINKSFTEQIGKGTIKINQQLPRDQSFKSFRKPIKQINQIQEENASRIKEIQLKKNSILAELKNLYQDQQKLRARQKLLFLKKKAQHSFILTKNNSKNDLTQNDQKKQKSMSPSFERKSLSPKKYDLKSNLSSSSIASNKSTNKSPLNKHTSLPRSVFTEEQKKAINEIIKRKNQNQIRQKQKLQKLLEKLNKQQMQLIEQERIILNCEREKRKKQALQRLAKNKNTVRNSRNRIHTEPIQNTHNNQKSQTSLNKFQQNHSFSRITISPRKKYSYLINHHIDQNRIKQSNQNSRLILQKRKLQTKFNFQEIKIHLKDYQKKKKQQTQIQKQKIQHFKLTQKQRIKQIKQKYGFMTKIKENLIEEERDSVLKYQQQINRKINFQQKMKDYFYSIANKPKMRSRSNLVESRNLKAISEGNFRIRSSKYLYDNSQELKKKTSFSYGSPIKPQNYKTNAKYNVEYNHEAEIYSNQKTPSSSTLELKKISQDSLAKRKTELKQKIEKKQREMINILKRDSSSLKDIKKALQIFHKLDRQTFTPLNRQKRQISKKEVAW